MEGLISSGQRASAGKAPSCRDPPDPLGSTWSLLPGALPVVPPLPPALLPELRGRGFSDAEVGLAQLAPEAGRGVRSSTSDRPDTGRPPGEGALPRAGPSPCRRVALRNPGCLKQQSHCQDAPSDPVGNGFLTGIFLLCRSGEWAAEPGESLGDTITVVRGFQWTDSIGGGKFAAKGKSRVQGPERSAQGS